MKTNKLLLTVALLPLTGFAQERLDYTFVEASYLDVDRDVGAFDVGGDGLALKGSLSLTDTVFVFADYSTYDYSRGVDADGYNLGAGMRWGLKPELDLIADLSWAHVEIDTPFGDADDDGLGLGVGLRSRIHDDIEVQGGIRHVDLDDSNTYLSLAGRYYFTDTVAVGLGLDFDDDNTGWNIGLRAEFGN
ncbi:MAG: outer membrane beta-barrel protein [Gammaproteobacteria bacterium]|nr:outer membrane beta-barrel protein [Gammaproteobacteria bacterium]